MQYVTARGWEDLSLAIGIYEKKKFDVNRNLVQQYITDTEIAGKFSIYYDLFKKYKSDYKVEDILHGILSQELLERVEKAGFDERISLLGLILENLNMQFDQTVHQEMVLERVVKILRIAKKEAAEKEDANIMQILEENSAAIQAERDSAEAANSLSKDQKREYRDAMALLKEYMTECAKAQEPKKQFQRIKKRFDAQAKKHQSQAEEVKEYLENAFCFLAQAWGNGQEMILFMTELTANADSMHFIELWGSASYFKYNQDLLIYDVHQKLQREIMELL